MVRRTWYNDQGSYDLSGRELAAVRFLDASAAHQELIQRLHNARQPLYCPWGHGHTGTRKTFPIDATVEIRQRKLAAQRPLETADPFNRYYRLGADKGQHNLILQTHLDDRDPEGSTNVHWSYGGWEKQGWICTPDGLTSEKQRKYFEALNNTPPRQGSLDVYNGSTNPLSRTEASLRQKNALKSSLRFSSDMTDMYRVFGSPHDTDFNMIGTLESLWDTLTAGGGQEAQRLDQMRLDPETLRFLKYGADELIIDESVTTFTHIFKIEPRVLSMLATVGWTVEEFETRHHDHTGDHAVDFNRDYSSLQARNNFRRLRREFFAANPDSRGGALARSLGRRTWARLRRNADSGGHGQGGLAGLFLALYGPEDYRGDEEWSRHREWRDYQPEYTSRITGLDVYRTIEAWLTENDPTQKDAYLRDVISQDVPQRWGGNRGYGSYHDYEFYDFLTEVPFVRDAATEQVATFPGYQQAFSSSILQGAYIDPEYNFYNPTYEQAISRPNISELILPNMYMYQLATPSIPAYGTNPRVNPWDSSAGREQQGAFDRLLRLDEFIDTIVPLQRHLADVGARANLEESQMNDYLSDYGRVVEGTPEIAIELGGSVANEYYNTVTNASHMNIYDEFNGYKNNFPMYIEIGIPLAPVGGFSEVFSDWISSTGIVNSFLNTAPISRDGTPFRFQTRAVEQYNYGQGPRARSTLARLKESVKVYDYDDWKSNLRQEVGQGLQGGGSAQIGTLPGISPQWINSLLHTATNWVNNYASSRKRLYYHYIHGFLGLCDSETIMYKLIKIKVTEDPQDRARDQEEILQNFYFPNIDPGDGDAGAGRFGEGERLTNILKFVDTQVKYEQSYRYELRGYEVVYGSTFRFRKRERVVPEAPNEESPEQNKVLYSFNVETLPNVKIVEYPILTSKWESSRLGRVSTNRSAFGGVSYPTVRVQDKPPVPPEVSIKPYKDEPNKILILLTTGIGNYSGQSSRPYVAFDSEEREQYEQIRRHQSTQENYSLPPGHIEFKNEGSREIKEMLVYRIDGIDSAVASKTELYTKNFTDVKPIKRLNIFMGSYDMTDTIQPNKKYYYTFRSVDVHDKKSFPTEIYEVELVSDKGLFVPNIRIFNPDPVPNKKSSKKLSRFLEISTADIQSLPIEETNESTELVMAKRSVVDANSENGVAANKFVIRLTSQDTGRKLDLVLNFNVNETVAEEE